MPARRTPLSASVALSISALALVATGCGGADPPTEPAPAVATDDDAGSATAALPTTTASVDSIWPTAPATLDPAAPAEWTIEIVETLEHDSSAFTQGLELLADGRLLESTGLYGESTIRVVDPTTGEIQSSQRLDAGHFGEGATVVDDVAVQLTWQAGVAYRWQLPDLTPLAPFTYDGEGWGLCDAGDRLAMSDGTSQLEWRDRVTFDVLETVSIRLGDAPVADVNELECIDGLVVANVWLTPELIVVRPDGAVVGVIDASVLVDRTPVADPDDVLNGIADLGDGTLLLGGKRWPTLYRVRLVDS